MAERERLLGLDVRCGCGKSPPFRWTLTGVTAIRSRMGESLERQATLATWRCGRCKEVVELTAGDLLLA